MDKGMCYQVNANMLVIYLHTDRYVITVPHWAYNYYLISSKGYALLYWICIGYVHSVATHATHVRAQRRSGQVCVGAGTHRDEAGGWPYDVKGREGQLFCMLI
jgi:hypothetical protein